MRKFKVVKKWPSGPEVGAILFEDYQERLNKVHYLGKCREYGSEQYYCILELEGFVEEVKEPEEFWYVDSLGVVQSSKYKEAQGWIVKDIPNWLRFRIKGSAEQFVRELKNSHGTQIDHYKHDTQSIWNALNDRVTD